MSGLNHKQKKFICEYLVCWNATEAARLAGYKHPRQQGSRLLSHVDISKAIRQHLQASAMSANEALKLLAEQARFDAGIFLVGGERIEVNLDLMKDAGVTHLIKSITPTRDGTRIEFYDKQVAMNMILKAHGAFKERRDHGGEIALRVIYENAVNSQAEETT